MKHKTHSVPVLASPIRLQDYGVGIFDEVLTKSALKKVLKKQRITVNNTVASTATFIKGGETITLITNEIKSKHKQFRLQLSVIFEDEHLALIHKPAGVLVSGNHFKTITNALTQNLKPSSLLDVTKPQPVHRLDYPTTGLLLIGKTNSSIRALNKLFENKAIEKTYYAITIGKMKDTQGEITSIVDDKTAQSNYSVIASIASKRFGTLNLVKLKPKTGRKHQLRIHLAAIGHPILGDKNYGVEPLILNGKGLYLHAYSLKFTHPFTKEDMTLKDELPKRFSKIFPEVQL